MRRVQEDNNCPATITHMEVTGKEVRSDPPPVHQFDVTLSKRMCNQSLSIMLWNKCGSRQRIFMDSPMGCGRWGRGGGGGCHKLSAYLIL